MSREATEANNVHLLRGREDLKKVVRQSKVTLSRTLSAEQASEEGAARTKELRVIAGERDGNIVVQELGDRLLVDVCLAEEPQRVKKTWSTCVELLAVYRNSSFEIGQHSTAFDTSWSVDVRDGKQDLRILTNLAFFADVHQKGMLWERKPVSYALGVEQDGVIEVLPVRLGVSSNVRPGMEEQWRTNHICLATVGQSLSSVERVRNLDAFIYAALLKPQQVLHVV